MQMAHHRQDGDIPVTLKTDNEPVHWLSVKTYPLEASRSGGN